MFPYPYQPVAAGVKKFHMISFGSFDHGQTTDINMAAWNMDITMVSGSSMNQRYQHGLQCQEALTIEVL